MGRLKQKGKAGAARAYTTRSAAVKKLQCSLADFRRLCILKGIFPREPRHRKRANKGSSAPTSFYYTKDIAYLAHEPVLRKLREHKAFAKKLSRAIGRGEWSSAKSLEDNKPVYHLDHIIKERYPTFIDAVRDIDDALCMIFLFANLPASSRVSVSLVDNCTRLASEWQLYVLHSRSLRKVFLSIKGVYYQAEIMGQTVTWLVPYQFTQNIPSDVDVRVMLTFLELYQTLLGFVFFKLYTDAGLIYPPPLDANKDNAGAGVGAFSLQESSSELTSKVPRTKETQVGKKVSVRDVRQTIKAISSTILVDEDSSVVPEESVGVELEEDFVPRPSKTSPEETASLSTLQSLSNKQQSERTDLFAPYTFWLSRETSRPIFEFIVRSFGGRIGWPASSGGGSPFDETEGSITHVIIDRPVVDRSNETTEEQERRRARKYIQPQWVVDCINAGKILLEQCYAQGTPLPPHLSPFGDVEGAYDPIATEPGDDQTMLEMEASEESAEDADLEEIGTNDGENATPTLKGAVAAAADDPEALRAVELSAEAAGVDYGTFEKEVGKSLKQPRPAGRTQNDGEQDMNKMLMSNKQRKLYERMKYGEKKKAAERTKLEQRRHALDKERRRKSSGVV